VLHDQVLFVRHGYRRPDRHHNNNPNNSLLPKVLEQGYGSPLLLGVIYMEVARRMGLVLDATPLSEGAQRMF
jgi:regulator of sirC expression with transglutaminase-like and TPR domain